MIARLKGIIDSLGADQAVIDVGGVGYLVFASSRTLAALPAPGEAAALFVETHVREDHIHLYGFATPRERELFRLLTGVSGVGAKVALAILSALDAETLSNAIAAQDKTAVARAQGVGPRLAQRVVTELRDKVAGIAFAPPGVSVPAAAGTGSSAAGDSTPSGVEDAVSALVNLGYGRAEAYSAVATVARQMGGDAGLDTLIRAGLKELSA